MNVLKDLLRIKIFREEKAELAVARARLHLVAMEEALEKARRALKEYRLDCTRKEKVMFEGLCSRLVLIRDIDEVSLDVRLMKENLSKLEKKVEDAVEERKQAADAVEVSRQIHRDAVRMREKFTELVQTVDDERTAELLRLEDLELEEAASTRHAKEQSQSDDVLADEAWFS